MRLKTIHGLFVVALILLLVLFSVTIKKLYKFYEFDDHVSNSYENQKDLVLIEREFMGLFGVQRTYIFSQDEKFLKLYESRKDELNRLGKHLQKGFQHDQIQLRRVILLEKLVKERVAMVDKELIEALNSSDKLAYMKKSIDENVSNSYAITALINEVQDHENTKLSTFKDSQELEKRYLPLFLLIASVASLSLLWMAYLTLSKELKINQETLKVKRKLLGDLSQANLEIEQYAFAVTHSLQEPIRKIRIFLDRASQHINQSSEPVIVDMFHKVNESAIKSSDLLKGLQDFSSFRENPTQTHLLDIRQIFYKKIEACKHHFDFVEEVNSEADMIPLLMGNEFEIEKLVENIVKNSFQHVDPAKKLLNLKLTYQRVSKNDETQWHQLTFEDNGEGFESNYAEQIFRVFNKLNRTKDITRTGMGLSICRQIMKNHGGKIAAEGHLGVGAKFICTFPQETSKD